MFSKDGNIAYYDSKAETFIINKKSDYKNIQKIENRSLLCFSPSGKYIALSDQNYIDYTHHPYENWGHQPSGNVFIHAIEEPQVCISQYNDFGNGISGVVYSGKSGRAGNVASVAFSSDEKRLMAVGNDGVVVVRNLHFRDAKLDIELLSGNDNDECLFGCGDCCSYNQGL
jgi:WD40 repeat protein